MSFVLPWWVTFSAALAVAALAFLRGGRTERLVATLAVVDVGWAHGQGLVYGERAPWALAHDLLAAAAMSAVALRVNRYWPMAAASALLVSAATALAHMIDPVDGRALGTAQLGWYYMFLGCLAVGSWRTSSRGCEASEAGAV
jgi:hypothetical protein